MDWRNPDDEAEEIAELVYQKLSSRISSCSFTVAEQEAIKDLVRTKKERCEGVPLDMRCSYALGIEGHIRLPCRAPRVQIGAKTPAVFGYRYAG